MKYELTKEQILKISNLSDKEWQKVRYEYVATHPYNLKDRERALKEAHAVLIRFSKPVWLTGGSILGAIRDNDFIPWDDDVDMDMKAADLTTILPELKKQLIDCGFIVRAKEDPLYPKLSFFKYGQKLSLGGLRENGVYLTRPRYKYPAKFFSSTDKIVFKDCEFLSPFPAREYLSYVYGNDWRTPKHSDDELEYMNPEHFTNKTRFLALKIIFLKLRKLLKRSS